MRLKATDNPLRPFKRSDTLDYTLALVGLTLLLAIGAAILAAFIR